MFYLSPATTAPVSSTATKVALSPLFPGLGTGCEKRDDAKRRSACVATMEVSFLKGLAAPLMAALVTLSPLYFTPVSLGLPADIQRGGALFRRACIGCHDAGGNIIQPAATLFAKDLQRNGLDSEEDIYRVTYYGKGRMPGFGESCSPRGQCTFGPRLTEEEIKLIAEYVKLQADLGWPNAPSPVD